MKNVMAQRILLQECKEDVINEQKKKQMLNDIRREQELLDKKRKLIETGITVDSEIEEILKRRNPSRRKFNTEQKCTDGTR